MEKKNDNTDIPVPISTDKQMGLRQCKRAVKEGLAKSVTLARDADEWLASEVKLLCEQHKVPLTVGKTRAEIGKEFGITVTCAVITEIKEV